VPPSPPRPRSRHRIVEVALVLALTGAIVVLAFTAVDGGPRATAGSKFVTVGQSIAGSDSDHSSGEWDTDPMDDEEPFAATGDLFAALPADEDIEDLLEISDGRVTMQIEEYLEPGPAKAFCSDVAPDAVEGAWRAWTASGGGVEVDARIHELGSVAEARRAIESRQTDAFLACIPDGVESSVRHMQVDGGEITDSSTTTTGDQLEQILLIERGEEGTLFAWRQVDRYVVTIKVFDFDNDEGAALDLTSADDLLALSTEALGG